MSKILIVEDDSFLLEMLVKAGIGEGFSVEIAVDGEEGLKKIETGDFDIILLDLVLPKLHGLELLKKLDSEKNITPVIVLSNLYDQESVDIAKSFGVKDYIVKAQTTPKSIMQKVKTLLSESVKTAS